MRVLIVSDTHGRHTSLDRALKEAGDKKCGHYYVRSHPSSVF